MNVNQVANVLQRNPTVYLWERVEIGPNFTAERLRYDRYELKEGTAHRGLFPGIEEAIVAAMSLDDLITIPQDLAEAK